MFSFREHTIISAVPMAAIVEYLHNIGAVSRCGSKYDYAGLDIEITPYTEDAYPDLGIPRHVIAVRGDPIPAERFLTDFRFRFLSAGG